MARFSIFLFSFLVSCSLPRDPFRTLDRVRGKTVRVGVVENPPWVARAGEGEPSGVEVALVREWASRLQASVRWTWAPEHRLVEALRDGELDLAVGGFTESLPGKEEIGLTRVYFVERVLVGAPPGRGAPYSLEDLSVAVREGTQTAHDVEGEGARALRVPDPFATGELVAAPEWQLESRGFSLSKKELRKDEHVMVVRPGENGWLMALESFLNEKEPAIEALLKREERP